MSESVRYCPEILIYYINAVQFSCCIKRHNDPNNFVWAKNIFSFGIIVQFAIARKKIIMLPWELYILSLFAAHGVIDLHESRNGRVSARRIFAAWTQQVAPVMRSFPFRA